MDCEKCGGPMYDNRQKKENGQYKANAPDFTCRDKEGCGFKKWLKPKSGGGNGGAQARSGAGSGNGSAGNGRAVRPLGPLYYECLKIASESVKKLVPNASPTDIVAATATLFIGATNTGAPLRTAPKPPPPPPPPKQEFEEFGGDEDEGAWVGGAPRDESDLPF